MNKYLQSLLFLAFISFNIISLGQSRLVINGAYINIKNNAQFTIDNSNPNAITRTLNGGHFISEAENNNVHWNIGSTNGDYKIPFGIGTADYLPLEFTTYGGVGNGYFELATYDGGNYLNSSYLPSGITNFRGLDGTDNSPHVMDRFWKIRAENYDHSNADRPDFNFLLLSYRDVEHNRTGNSIIESDVFIQRYNPVLDSWYDYIPGNAVVAVNTTENEVSVDVVPNNEVFDWWVIVDRISPLPLELLTFDANTVNNQFVLVDWATATEKDMNKFVVERSKDGKTWEFVAEAPAQNLNSLVKYQTTDHTPYTGLSYYRLKQIELSGNVTYSQMKEVTIQESEKYTLTIFPNPTVEVLNLQFSVNHIPKSIVVYDVQGKEMYSKNIKTVDSDIIPLNVKSFAQGTYLLKIYFDEDEGETYKFVKM
ncbi:MAG: T9SS type A sorting domain-containing protein [Chitinophagales bacterium]|nr:T9SS type A sorting domain-containing protein [Chitinophagales bacterium]